MQWTTPYLSAGAIMEAATNASSGVRSVASSVESPVLSQSEAEVQLVDDPPSTFVNVEPLQRTTE